MNKFIAGCLICMILWLGCARDTIPPTIIITNPADRTNVRGVVAITAEATDNKGVEKVEFYINGLLASTVTEEPYSYLWVTTGLQDFSGHIIYAKAYDAAGNEGFSQVILVWVNN